MNAPFGYTPKQAERIKHAIDKDVARIEDTLLRLMSRVTDVSATSFACESPETVLERVRELADELDDVIDRRTRS